MADKAKSLELKLVYDGRSNSGHGMNLSIIVLPELGMQTSSTTLKTLGDMYPSSGIYDTQYTINEAAGMMWTSMTRKGNELVEVLLQLPEVWEYPTIFICHGFGGILLKRALGIMEERYWDKKLKLLRLALAGIVFISTPHLKYAKPELWPQLNIILRSCPGYSKWQDRNELSTITNICAKFEESLITQPVLSLYESEATKISDGFYQHKKVLLVGRDLAETFVQNETRQMVEENHFDIADIKHNTAIALLVKHFFTRVVDWVTASTNHTLQMGMQQTTITDRVDDTYTWATTVSHAAPEDHDPEILLSKQNSKDDSGQATQGTPLSASSDINKILVNTIESEPAVKLPCYALSTIERNPDFFGREDIMQALDMSLLPSRQQEPKSIRTPKAVVLCGLGGVGKTQCAQEYALSRKNAYEAVFWTSADSTQKLDESFAQISVILGLETETKAGDRVVSRNLVMEWLSNPLSQRPTTSPASSMPELVNWLLIFDNVDDPSVLADFWPASGPGFILITSRDSIAKRYLSCGSIDLEPFPTNVAAGLLRRLSHVEGNHEEIEGSNEVAERLGGLPLAITLAAAAILRHDLLFAEFLNLYENEPQAVDVKPFSLRPDLQYQYTLSTVWKLDALTEPTINLLRLLSVMDPDEIDEKVLTCAVGIYPPGYPATQTMYLAARTDLLKLSLIKRDKVHSRLSIHRLTQDFTRTKMGLDEVKRYVSLAIELLTKYWPRPVVAMSYSRSNWPAMQAASVHLIFLHNLWKRQPSIMEDSTLRLKMADLCWRVAWYFVERGDDGEVVSELLLSSHMLCEEDASLAITETHAGALFALSSLSNFQNRAEDCLKYSTLNLETNIKLKRPPEEDQMLGIAYQQQGWGLMLTDQWPAAIQSLRDSLEVYSRWVEVSERGYRPEFAWNGLALALAEIGQLEEAVEMLEDSIKWRAERFGPDDTDSIKLGWANQGVGSIRFKEGRYREALQYYLKALANYVATSSPRYFRTGQVYVKLAEIYAHEGDFALSDVYFAQSYKLYENRDAYKGDLSRALHKQAQIYRAVGKNKAIVEDLESRAKKLYKEVVLSGRLKVYGASLEHTDFDKVVSFWAR